MANLLVIADDFTGALDVGVKFVSNGINTHVIADVDCLFEGQVHSDGVLVVNAETRHQNAEKAYQTVYDLVKWAHTYGIHTIFKKTDSALRGNVGSELAAAMQASGEKRLFFAPAFPQIGRTTKQGIHYIGDFPVSESSFGRDPFEPVKFSSIVKIIAQQTDTVVINHYRHELISNMQISGIHVFDAETDADLDRIMGKALESGVQLLAGCAGFADSVAKTMKIEAQISHENFQMSHFLAVYGSLHPQSLRQLALAERQGVPCVALTPEQKLNPSWLASDAGIRTVKECISILKKNRSLILSANPAGTRDGTKEYIATYQIENEVARERIADCLTKVAAEVIEASDNLLLVCTGGDVLCALLRALNISCLLPLREIEPGVVLSELSITGKRCYVISKAGAFGSEDLLCNLAKKYT